MTFREPTPLDSRHHAALGQGLLEFALALSVFLLVIFGIMEFGRLLYTYTTLANAAEEGARYGIISPTDVSGIKGRVVTYGNILGISTNNVTVTSDNVTIQVAVSYDFQPLLPWVLSRVPLNASASMVIER